jgi:TATA-binding protein-associated factor Taf7
VNTLHKGENGDDDDDNDDDNNNNDNNVDTIKRSNEIVKEFLYLWFPVTVFLLS